MALDARTPDAASGCESVTDFTAWEDAASFEISLEALIAACQPGKVWSEPVVDRDAASGLRRPRPHCAWCGRRTSSPRFKTCREHYDLEQALRLYYNGGRHNGERV